MFAGAGWCIPARHGRHRLLGRLDISTITRVFAADLLQVQRSATIDAIHDCGSRRPGACMPGEDAEVELAGIPYGLDLRRTDEAKTWLLNPACVLVMLAKAGIQRRMFVPITLDPRLRGVTDTTLILRRAFESVTK